MIPARHLFGYAHEGDCCRHSLFYTDGTSDPVANGYDHATLSGLYEITIEGVSYISDRYAAVRSDLVDLGNLTVEDATKNDTSKLVAKALDRDPVDALYHPSTAGRLLALGVQFRATETVNDRGVQIVALVLDGKQIGIYQATYSGVSLDDLAKVVRVARDMYAGDPVPCDLELTTVADVLTAAGVITHVKESQ